MSKHLDHTDSELNPTFELALERVIESSSLPDGLGDVLTKWAKNTALGEGIGSNVELAIVPNEYVQWILHNDKRWKKAHEMFGHKLAADMYQLEMVAACMALAYGEEAVASMFHSLSVYVQEGGLGLDKVEEQAELYATNPVPDTIEELTEGEPNAEE